MLGVPMTDINELNDRFGLSETVTFFSYGNDMAMAEVNSALCSAKVALQGAQVFAWAPVGEQPVIWLSDQATFAPGKSLRGGVPVCWPWFGAHALRSDFPAHGFARVVPWSVGASEALEDGGIRLVFNLDENAIDREHWPHFSPLELHMTFGTSLELELITRNTGSRPVTLTEALHTYFAVGDVRQVRVSGLEGCEYLDKVDAFARKTQQGPVTIDSEVDRIYLDTEAECVIEDGAWQRRIHIAKRGSQSTVVWNPWEEKATALGDMGEVGFLSMLCVESANAAENTVTIEPQDEHRLWVSYRLEKI